MNNPWSYSPQLSLSNVAQNLDDSYQRIQISSIQKYLKTPMDSVNKTFEKTTGTYTSNEPESAPFSIAATTNHKKQKLISVRLKSGKASKRLKKSLNIKSINIDTSFKADKKKRPSTQPRAGRKRSRPSPNSKAMMPYTPIIDDKSVNGQCKNIPEEDSSILNPTSGMRSPFENDAKLSSVLVKSEHLAQVTFPQNKIRNIQFNTNEIEVDNGDQIIPSEDQDYNDELSENFEFKNELEILQKEPRLALYQKSKGKVIKNTTKEYAMSQKRLSQELPSPSQEEGIFKIFKDDIFQQNERPPRSFRNIEILNTFGTKNTKSDQDEHLQDLQTIHKRRNRKYTGNLQISRSAKKRLVNKNSTANSADRLNDVLNVNKLVVNDYKNPKFAQKKDSITQIAQREVDPPSNLVLLSNALQIVENSSSSRKDEHSNEKLCEPSGYSSAHLNKQNRYKSALKKSNLSTIKDPGSSCMDTTPKDKKLDELKRIVNHSRQSVNAKKMKQKSNLQICFHRKKLSVTPNPEIAMPNDTFDEEEKDEVHKTANKMKMVVKKIKKKHSEPNQPPRTNSINDFQKIQNFTNNFEQDLFDYEKCINSNNGTRRVQTAKQNRIQFPSIGEEGFRTFYNPILETKMATFNENLYLTKKSFYERFFEREEPKDGIKIVGQNIKKYIENFERITTEKQREHQIEDTSIEKFKKIDLKIENNNLNNSNDTYSAIIVESDKRTRDGACRTKNADSFEKERSQSPNIRENNSNALDDSYRQNRDIDHKSSKILIANVKKLYRIRGGSANSRESDLKMKTKDSNEYSYGNEIGKMEPKIDNSEKSSELSPNAIKEKEDDYDRSSCISKKHNSMSKNESIISNCRSKGKILFSKTREKHKVSLSKYNDIRLNHLNLIRRGDSQKRKIISHPKSIEKDTVNLVIRPKMAHNNYEVTNNRHFNKVFGNRVIQSRERTHPHRSYVAKSKRLKSAKVGGRNRKEKIANSLIIKSIKVGSTKNTTRRSLMKNLKETPKNTDISYPGLEGSVTMSNPHRKYIELNNTSKAVIEDSYSYRKLNFLKYLKI
ncbi:unnamed protein product [Moneuplotes crassus]|uniref:Uncharacterized protein n=1 Tax=Euplotes crassus TaxID=5936 RepID=A0AAD1USL8_EUPCR|nr:unnamed protein product [Moneuplotes crassus]